MTEDETETRQLAAHPHVWTKQKKKKWKTGEVKEKGKREWGEEKSKIVLMKADYILKCFLILCCSVASSLLSLFLINEICNAI